MNRRDLMLGFAAGIPAVIATSATGGANAVMKPAMSPKKGIIHIECGHSEWEPNQEELEQIADLFLVAWDDPKGGVVATRTGVRVTYYDC